MKPPIWTLFFCVSATLVFLFPETESVLIFNRAAIESGEWWRIFTGNLVHFSPTHFLSDTIALLVIGTLIESRKKNYWWLVSLVVACLVGLTIYFYLPDVQLYGGLSGIVSAAIIYFCLCELREQKSGKWLYIALLILIVTKISMEFASRSSLLLVATPQPFILLPASHLVGAGTGLFAFVLLNIKHFTLIRCVK